MKTRIAVYWVCTCFWYLCNCVLSSVNGIVGCLDCGDFYGALSRPGKVASSGRQLAM